MSVGTGHDEPDHTKETGRDESAPLDGGQVDKATALVLLGSDPWARFDLWALRAWELANRAVEAATQEGGRNTQVSLGEEVRYDPRASTLTDAARLACDLAQAVCPLAGLAGLPPRIPELELKFQ